MGPVLGVLNDRYAGRITSRRPPRQNAPLRPRRSIATCPMPLGKAEAATYSPGEGRLQIPSPHHQHKGRPTQGWSYSAKTSV
jgi:hypothetical protein